jgi:ribbon-helix-helix CopG family protein
MLAMAKSFRLDPDLERRLELAAARDGVPASALIRDAVRRRCDEVLGGTLLHDLGEIVGAADIGGDQSRRTGDALAELLQERHKRPRK